MISYKVYKWSSSPMWYADFSKCWCDTYVVVQHCNDIYSCHCGVWLYDVYTYTKGKKTLNSQNKFLLLQFPGVYVPFVYPFVSHNHMRWPWTKYYHCQKEHESYANCAVGMTFPSQNKRLTVLLLICLSSGYCPKTKHWRSTPLCLPMFKIQPH